MGKYGRLAWHAAWCSAFVVSMLAGLRLTAHAAETTAGVPPAATISRFLDGKTFRVQVLDDQGRKRPDDRLIFRGGDFHSESCIPFGFSRRPYWIRVEGDTIHFLAETVSPTHGTMVWRGTVTGDHLEGNYLWTKERWYWTIRRRFEIVGNRER